MARSIQGDCFKYLAMNVRLHACVAGLLAALVAACSTSSTTERVTNADELKPLAFLRAGPVSRKDIEGRLGVPWSVYEDGRIVIYHLDAVTEPLRRAQRSGTLHLVIVYTNENMVEQWSLVDTYRRR
jgi:hypothetical protein